MASEDHSFKCGAINMGGNFKLLSPDGTPVASGIAGSIRYRRDWSVSAITDEVSQNTIPIPQGATVLSVDPANCVVSL